MLFKTGEDLRSSGSAKTATRGLCFSENPWGEKARAWAVSTTKLARDDTKWTVAIDEAMTFWKRHIIDSDNDDASVDTDAPDLCTAIEIDW